MTATVLLRRIVDRNVSASRALEHRLHLASDKPLWQEFEREARARLRDLAEGSTVLDLGGGRRCVYADDDALRSRLRLVAVDISAEELAMNTDVTETRVADVTEKLPFPDGSVDLVLSRALLEHVPDVGAAIREMGRVLRPGGVALHLVPGRFSLFGTAARWLPFGPLVRLLHLVMPWTRGQVEFDVHYDRCFPQALEEAFRASGFTRVETQVTWAQPGYFEAIFPLFVLHAGYEWVVRHLRLRRLAAYTVVRAVR